MYSRPSDVPVMPRFSRPARPFRVFLVDDHPIFERGAQAYLTAETGLELCGSARSAEEALEKLPNANPDVAMVDLGLPGQGGLELIRQLKEQYPALRMLACSAFDEQLYAVPALKAGASGYLMKSSGREALVEALQRIASGGEWVSEDLRQRLIFKVADAESPTSPLEELTDRELEVLKLIGQRMSSRQIAPTLGVSIKTVESHRLHIKQKLRLGHAAELVRFATQWVMQRAHSHE